MAATQSSDGKGMHAINITPMVDIILVLLVIFMVTSSTMYAEASIEVDKPEAATGAAASDVETLTLTCDASGAYFAGETRLVDGDEIRSFAAGVVAEQPEVQAVLRCDRAARVDALVTAIDALRRAGVHKYAIATDPVAPRP